MREAGLAPIRRSCNVRPRMQPELAVAEIGPKIGAIETGKLADLVILNSNPVDDIAHASDIATVVKNGVVYPADSILSK